ncbi:MAG: hypothetical protein AB1543_07165 [Candidatus Bipolaricaulota bacterium]
MPNPEYAFFPPNSTPASPRAAGFRLGHIGTHTSRTIMFAELASTLAVVPSGGKPEDYAAAIIEGNCLGKATVATRRLTLQRLRELYALDSAVPIFRILRRLWELDTAGRPLLALLAALARDPLLLATAEVVLSLPKGAEFQRVPMRDALAQTVDNRLNESTLNKVVRNTASSWTQSGHLEGRTFKHRQFVTPTPASTTFALYLARAVGFGTEESLSSGWMKSLDCSASSALEMATAAKRIGLLDLRMAGNVIDLRLDRLDPLFRGSAQTR